MPKVWRDTKGMDTLLRILRQSLESGKLSQDEQAACQILLRTLGDGAGIDAAVRTLSAGPSEFDGAGFVRDMVKLARTIATLEQMRDMSPASKVSWATSDDALTCATCWAKEVEVRSLAIADALAFSAPPIHRGCRCMWIEDANWDYVMAGRLPGRPNPRPPIRRPPGR